MLDDQNRKVLVKVCQDMDGSQQPEMVASNDNVRYSVNLYVEV